jgi:hypothetical protein
VEVDERIVVQDFGAMCGDEPHTSHIGGQGKDLVDAARRLEAVIPPP